MSEGDRLIVDDVRESPRQIRYCTNGCTRTTAGERIPVQIQPPSRVCNRCEDNLHQWLTTIPELYATLPLFITPGTVAKNPDSKTTKAAEAPVPVRLEVLDLLDARLGRKWLGTTPAHDRRGIVGLLLVHTERLIEDRSLSADLADPPTVTRLCSILDRHRLWIAEQDWIKYIYDDLKQAHRALSDANGEYRRPPVGRCHIDTDEGKPCGGPLFANDAGGVHCARCHAVWDADHLRQLGLAQAAARETA